MKTTEYICPECETHFFDNQYRVYCSMKCYRTANKKVGRKDKSLFAENCKYCLHLLKVIETQPVLKVICKKQKDEVILNQKCELI